MITKAPSILERVRQLWPAREWELAPAEEREWETPEVNSRSRRIRTTTLLPVEVEFSVHDENIEAFIWVNGPVFVGGDDQGVLIYHCNLSDLAAGATDPIDELVTRTEAALIRWAQRLLSGTAGLDPHLRQAQGQREAA